jgi:hypothetical protein
VPRCSTPRSLSALRTAEHRAASASPPPLRTRLRSARCLREIANSRHPNTESHVRRVICHRLYVLTKTPTAESLKEIIALLAIKVNAEGTYLLSIHSKKTWKPKSLHGYDGARLWLRDLLDRLCGIFINIRPQPESQDLEQLDRIVRTLSFGQAFSGDVGGDGQAAGAAGGGSTASGQAAGAAASPYALFGETGIQVCLPQTSDPLDMPCSNHR